MRARFHGGPLDGRTLDLPDDTYRWEVPLPAPFDWNELAEEHKVTNKPPALRRVTYERMVRRYDEPDNLFHLAVPFVLHE